MINKLHPEDRLLYLNTVDAIRLIVIYIRADDRVDRPHYIEYTSDTQCWSSKHGDQLRYLTLDEAKGAAYTIELQLIKQAIKFTGYQMGK